ncbi:MAG: ABC transporter ATP-binding protein [Pseudochelatococcus sp.]|jgi:sulfonate transport system ATP-binding protein|uniref:ABC transporter ATP-binding protein n=1 Tax=Pseudochelatococcus sp. TaxID=2020869 RepID=UPI003D91129D
MTVHHGNLAVHAAGLRRVFDDRPVLNGVGIDIAPGEFVALLGRSGSGKSTFLRVLAGLDADIEGTVRVAAERAVVFQDARLIPWKRVLANIVLGLEGAGAGDRARQVLAEVGLADHADAWPATLSGGEAQRVALARALARRPDLLLLDEPFGALDALTRVKMHTLLRNLCAKYRPAVLLVTHDVDEAILLADRILVLTDGMISLDVPVDIPSPRLRSDRAVVDLRARLLAELGVEERAG